MRLSRTLATLVATLSMSTIPRPADAEPPTPPTSGDSGPAGLLTSSPAEAWGNTSLWVMLTDITVKPAKPAPQLSFEILVFDREDPSKAPLDSLDPKDLALTLDGLYVPGTWEVTPFEKSGRGVALGLLIAGHRGYTAPLDEDSGQMWSPFAALIEGTKALLPKLGKNDKVGLFGFTHDEFKTVRGFGPAAGLADLVGNLPSADSPTPQSPEIYRNVLKALSIFQESVAELPTRKILLFVSDGSNITDNPVAIKRQITEAAELAVAEKVTPWVIGFTLGEPNILVNLQVLTSKTQGRYLALGFDEHKTLSDRFAKLAEDARGGFVVTLTPAPGVRLPESARDVRLALRSGGGVGRAFHGKLKIPR